MRCRSRERRGVRLPVLPLLGRSAGCPPLAWLRPGRHGRLHYAKPTFHGEKLEDAFLYQALSGVAAWRQAQRGMLPQMVWMDTPVQVGGPVGAM